MTTLIRMDSTHYKFRNTVGLALAAVLFSSQMASAQRLQTETAIAPLVKSLMDRGIDGIGDLDFDSLLHSQVQLGIDVNWHRRRDELTQFEGWNVSDPAAPFAVLSPEAVSLPTDGGAIVASAFLNHELFDAAGYEDEAYQMTAPMALLQLGLVSTEADPELFTHFTNLRKRSAVPVGLEASERSGGTITGVGGGGHRACVGAKIASLLIAHLYKDGPEYRALYDQRIADLLRVIIVPYVEDAQNPFTPINRCLGARENLGRLVFGLKTSCWMDLFAQFESCIARELHAGSPLRNRTWVCAAEVEQKNSGLSHMRIAIEIVKRTVYYQ